MEFCENFYKNLPNDIMAVLSDLTEDDTEKQERRECYVRSLSFIRRNRTDQQRYVFFI